MPISSVLISQLLGQHNQMMMQQQAVANSISNQHQPVDPFHALNQRQFSGERLTTSSLGMTGSIAEGAAGIGGGIASGLSSAAMFGFAPTYFDPFSVAFGAFGVGSRLGSAAPDLMGAGAMGTGLAFTAATGLGMYAGYKAVGHAVDMVIQGVHQHSNAAQSIYQSMPGSGMGLPGNIYSANRLDSSLMGSVNSFGVIGSPLNHDNAASLVSMGMSSGMYRGVNSIQQFTDRSNAMIASTLQTASLFGTGMEDAFVLNNQLRQQFGFTGSNAPGFMANLASHAVGSGLGIAGQMSAAEMGSASFQGMGASRSMGARYGAALSQRVGYADMSGIFGDSYELGGAAGLTSRFQQSATSMMSSRLGTNILAAAMGSDGRLDMNKAAMIAHGRMSADEVMKMAKDNMKSGIAQEQFALNQGDLMGSFLSSFGPEGALEAFQGMGLSNTEMMGVTGLDKDSLRAFRQLSSGGSSVRDRIRAAARQGFESGSGHKDISSIISKQIDKIVQPVNEYFREIGRDISSSISESVDSLSRDFYGKRAARTGDIGIHASADAMYAAGGYGAADSLYGNYLGNQGSALSGLGPNREGTMFGMLPAGIQHSLSGGTYDGAPMQDAMSYLGGATGAGSGYRAFSAMGGGRALMGAGISAMGLASPGWIANYGVTQASQMVGGIAGLVRAERAATLFNTAIPTRVAGALGQSAIPVGARFMGTMAGGRLLAGAGGVVLGGAGAAMRVASRLTGGAPGMILMESALRSQQLMGMAGTGTGGSDITGPQAEAIRSAYDAGMFKDLISTSTNRQLSEASGALSVESMVENATAERMTGGIGVARAAYNTLMSATSTVYGGDNRLYAGHEVQQLQINNTRAASQLLQRVASMGDTESLLRNIGRSSTAEVTTEAHAAINEAEAEFRTRSVNFSSDITDTDAGRFRAQMIEEKLQKKFGGRLSPQDIDRLRLLGGDKDVVAQRAKMASALGGAFSGMTVEDYEKSKTANISNTIDAMVGKLEGRLSTGTSATGGGLVSNRPAPAGYDNSGPGTFRAAPAGYDNSGPGTFRAAPYAYGSSTTGTRDFGTSIAANQAARDAYKDDISALRGKGGAAGLAALQTQIEGLTVEELARLSKGTGASDVINKTIAGLDPSSEAYKSMMVMQKGGNTKLLNQFAVSTALGRMESNNTEEVTKMLAARGQAYDATANNIGTFSENIGARLGGGDVAGYFRDFSGFRGAGQSRQRQESLDAAFRGMGDMSVEDLMQEGSFYMQMGKKNDDEISMIAGQMMLQRGSFKKVQQKIGKNVGTAGNQKKLIAELFGASSGVSEFLEKADAFGPKGDFDLNEQEDLRLDFRRKLLAGGAERSEADLLSRQFVATTKQIIDGQLKEGTLDENTPEGRAAMVTLQQGRRINDASVGQTGNDELDVQSKVLGKTIKTLSEELYFFATSVENPKKNIMGGLWCVYYWVIHTLLYLLLSLYFYLQLRKHITKMLFLFCSSKFRHGVNFFRHCLSLCLTRD